MSLSPDQGTLTPVPAGCCIRGNAAFLARKGARAQPSPQLSVLQATFLPKEVL